VEVCNDVTAAQVTHTRASLGHVHVVGGINEEQAEPFKMSRFRNVSEELGRRAAQPRSFAFQVPSRIHMH
jgi:hypothetical protein